nr:isoamylase [Pseudonocardia acidicola]
MPLGPITGRCSVVGDFNDWKPGQHEMRRRTNGTRSASVTVPRGTRLRFRYLGENGHWFNDPDVADRDGSDTILVV